MHCIICNHYLELHEIHYEELCKKMKHIVEKHRINDADTLIAMSDINGEFFVYIPMFRFEISVY